MSVTVMWDKHCDNCAHNVVCGKKSEFSKDSAAIDAALKEAGVKTTTIPSVRVNCAYYLAGGLK